MTNIFYLTYHIPGLETVCRVLPENWLFAERTAKRIVEDRLQREEDRQRGNEMYASRATDAQ